MSILIKNAFRQEPVYIEDNRIKAIGVEKGQKTDEVIDAQGKALLPGLVNTHTHAAMSLFKGMGDDMLLQQWLEERIWPAEEKLNGEKVYWGSRLAILEMIRTGTTCFNDMYFFMDDVARAAKETGIRAFLAYGFLDLMQEEKREEEIKETKAFTKKINKMNEPRVQPAVAPHSVYTVSRDGLKWCKNFADENGLLMHIHLSETRKENEDCVSAKGKRPTAFLDGLGALGENVVAAHCAWLTKGEVKVLADRDVKVSHNPCSNMKLASGGVMPYTELHEAGVTVALGTDGNASNNNLDLFEEMKFAALLQKAHRWDARALPASQAWDMATVNGAKALGIHAGVIEEDALADLILVDLKKPELTPNHDLVSNLVYSANGSCVTDVICDGELLMRHGVVKGEDKTLEKAEKIALNNTPE